MEQEYNGDEYNTNKIMDYKRKITALNKRIEELVLEKRDLNQDAINSEKQLECISRNLRNANNHIYELKNRISNQEKTISHIKQVNINLSTENTAIKMSEWCLSDPEQLTEIESGIELRNIYKQELEKNNIIINQLSNKINELNLLLENKNGTLQMISEVLKGGTMVLHPELSTNQSKSPIINTNIQLRSLVDDCGGFGIFEASPVQSDSEEIFGKLPDLVQLPDLHN